MSFKRRTSFTFILSIVLSMALLCPPSLRGASETETKCCNTFTLAPKSDLGENDLKITGWGLSVLKDIEKHAGKPADTLQIEDIFKVRKTASGNKTFESALLDQGYKIDEIPDQETVLISGNGHGIILYNSLYEPSADILSAKQTIKKGPLSTNVSFIIYNDLYSGILEELRGVEFDNKNLAAYVPIEVVQKMIEAETGRDRDEALREIFKEPLVYEKSSVVSIDLSGFTAMTDKLTEILAREKDPIRQAEAKKFVIEITNELFADIANVIDKFDASIIKFGGDARLVLVTQGTSATRALEMAQEIQVVLRYFGGILSEYFRNVEAVDVGKIGNIRASIGISSGTAYLVVPTDNYGLKDVVPLGDVFYRAIQAQDEAKKGITITEETRRQLVEEGRNGLFSIHPPDKLPADRYVAEDRKVLEEKRVHVIDQGAMSFLDYEVRDRINFTIEYMNAIFIYLKKENFHGANAQRILRIVKDFDNWKRELGQMKKQVTIGDLSNLSRLTELKRRTMEIRVAVDKHLLSFFPEKDPKTAGETQETLAKMSLKKDYGRYVADRVGELFYRFRTEANRRAFYSKQTLEKVKQDLAAFLPRGFEELIVKEEKKDFNVERMNFQNARIMFVQVYGLKELYDRMLAEKGPAEAARAVNEFYRKANGYATPENGIIYLKSDPGAQYLKMIYLGGLKYLSGVNPDTEMIKLAENLHRTAKEFGLEMKIGINSGPIILGLTGTNRRELTTISPEINLAARLGAHGHKGETIVSSRVYYASKDEVEYKERTDFYKDGARGIKVKGVSAEIPVFQPLKVLQVQKRGKFLRLKELTIAKEWIDAYLSTGPAPRLDALLIQTKELGLGSETLAYEVERYADSIGFKSYGGKGKDEYEIMKTLLEEFCKITAQDTPAERLGKIQHAVSKYAPDMTEYYPVLKILFPFLEFPESEIVNNLGDSEKMTVLNKLIEKFFTNRLKETEAGKRLPLFIRFFDIQHIKGDSIFLVPLINALKSKNVLIELVCNGPLPESLSSTEILSAASEQPSMLAEKKAAGALFYDMEDKLEVVKHVSLADLLKEPNHTIFVDKMDKGQILEVFHATCEFINKTALLREIDKLTLDDIRKMIDTDKMIKDLGLPIDTVIETIPLKNIHTFVKKLLSEKIYLLSGKGNPLIARHQAKRFIDLFYQKNIPEDQKGSFILKEVMSQNISGDNIAAFFRTQYNSSHFNNPRYRKILFDALCLGTEFDNEILLRDSLLSKEETQKRINELVDAGIFRRGDLGRLIFDNYIYDVFIKHADIDTIRRGRLKLARLMVQLFKKDDGSIDPEHINELAKLFYDSLNLNIFWEMQKKTLGVTEQDFANAVIFMETSANNYQEMARATDAIQAIEDAIALTNYRLQHNISSSEDDRARIFTLYNTLGNNYRSMVNTGKALQAYSTAIHCATSKADKLKVLFQGIYLLYYDQGKLDDAERVLNESEPEIKTVEPLSERERFQANYLNRYGVINFYKGNYKTAKTMWRKGIKLCKRINNLTVLSMLYTNFGNLYRRTGKLSESTKNINNAFKICKESDDQEGIIFVHLDLAINNKSLGRPSETIEEAIKGRALAYEINYRHLLPPLLIYAGEGYRLLGIYSKASEYYLEAKALTSIFGALPEERVDLIKGLGISSRKDHHQSIQYFREALSEANKIEDEKLKYRLILECYGYLIEEYLRYDEIKEALKVVLEVKSRKETLTAELLEDKDLQIRLGVIDRLTCEIDARLYQNNPESLTHTFEYALSCYTHMTGLKYKLGAAKDFALVLRIFNQIPIETPGWTQIYEKTKNLLSAFPEIEQYLKKSRIPMDKILLAEMYYETSKIVTLPSNLNPIPAEIKPKAVEYVKKAQDLLKRLIRDTIEDERVAYLQDRLLSKPTPIPITFAKEPEEAA